MPGSHLRNGTCNKLRKCGRDCDRRIQHSLGSQGFDTHANYITKVWTRHKVTIINEISAAISYADCEQRILLIQKFRLKELKVGF